MTKMTWHVNGRATSSRECSMYWSNRLHSVHCTMTFMSTHCGFPTPKTLYKPLPPPLKYPYPWKGYGFASGKGKGRCKNTRGLPMPITNHSKVIIILKKELCISVTCEKLLDAVGVESGSDDTNRGLFDLPAPSLCPPALWPCLLVEPVLCPHCMLYFTS